MTLEGLSSVCVKLELASSKEYRNTRDKCPAKVYIACSSRIYPQSTPSVIKYISKILNAWMFFIGIFWFIHPVKCTSKRTVPNLVVKQCHELLMELSAQPNNEKRDNTCTSSPQGTHKILA